MRDTTRTVNQRTNYYHSSTVRDIQLSENNTTAELHFFCIRQKNTCCTNTSNSQQYTVGRQAVPQYIPFYFRISYY